MDTKSGTNTIHGSAFEFNRLSAYTANTYGNDANGTPKGIYTRNEFGYNIGGPLIKNKLFAFFSAGIYPCPKQREPDGGSLRSLFY